jgi:hypothetical protein
MSEKKQSEKYKINVANHVAKDPASKDAYVFEPLASSILFSPKYSYLMFLKERLHGNIQNRHGG